MTRLCHNKKNSPRSRKEEEEEEEGGLCSLRRRLTSTLGCSCSVLLLQLQWRCSFHGRRSVSGCRKLEAGIPSSSYLRHPQARAFTPQQSSTATSNSAGDLWTCYAISTCYGRKAPAAAGLSTPNRDAPGPAPHGHGAISDSVPARMLAIFHEEQELGAGVT